VKPSSTSATTVVHQNENKIGGESKMTTKITAHDTTLLIQGSFQEVATQIEWLANQKHFYDPRWEQAEKDFQAVMLARQRYLEGEYELATKALPEF
jgi:hypothetical protein